MLSAAPSIGGRPLICNERVSLILCLSVSLVIIIVAQDASSSLAEVDVTVNETSPVEDSNNIDQPICSVCLDGSDSTDSDTSFQDFFGAVNSWTCNDVILASSSSEQGASGCESTQLAALQGGCCTPSSFFAEPASFDRCQLCPKGEGPSFLAFKEIPPLVSSSSTSSSFVTCGDLQSNPDVLAEFVQNYIESPGFCGDSLLRRSAGWCGCMGTSVECNLCDGKEINMAQEHPLMCITCRDLQYHVALLNATQCSDVDRYLNFDPQALCCPNNNNADTAPSKTISCPLCSNQEGLNQCKVVSMERYGKVSCGNVQAAANLLTSDQECTSLRQETSNECCVDTPSEESVATCELTCPETGQRPSNLLLEDVQSGNSCNYLVSEYAKFTASQCLNATNILGMDAVSLCCSNNDTTVDESGGDNNLTLTTELQQPAASPSSIPPTSTANGVVESATDSFLCRICPGGAELLYPRRVLFAYQEQTCQEVEEAALRIRTESDCWDLLDRSRALSNCACRRISDETDGNGDGPDSGGDNIIIDVSGSGTQRGKVEWRGIIGCVFLSLSLQLLMER